MANVHLCLLFVSLLGASIVKASPLGTPSLNEPIVIDPNTDPMVVAACFNYYLPILNEIANTFSIQYQACISLAATQTNELSAQAAQNQTSIRDQTEAICSGFETCSNATEVVEFFNCYANLLSEDISLVYEASSDANMYAFAFTQGLRDIQNNEAECATATENTYVTNTALTYGKLNNCFLAGVPTDSSSTEMPNIATETDDS